MPSPASTQLPNGAGPCSEPPVLPAQLSLRAPRLSSHPELRDTALPVLPPDSLSTQVLPHLHFLMNSPFKIVPFLSDFSLFSFLESSFLQASLLTSPWKAKIHSSHLLHAQCPPSLVLSPSSLIPAGLYLLCLQHLTLNADLKPNMLSPHRNSGNQFLFSLKQSLSLPFLPTSTTQAGPSSPYPAST